MSGINWSEIELDYRSGVLPQSAICVKYNISQSQLSQTAKKCGWERRPMDPLALQVAHGAASLPRFGMDSCLNETDLRKQAILTAASIVEVHRNDVMRLRQAAASMSTSLADFISACTSDEVDEVRANKALRVMGKDSPSDMLVKLSGVMAKLVSIERQAYGLDVLPVASGAEETTTTIQSEMSKLWNEVQKAQQNKLLVN